MKYLVLKTFDDKEDDNFRYEIDSYYQRDMAKKAAKKVRIEYLLANGFITEEVIEEEIEEPLE